MVGMIMVMTETFADYAHDMKALEKYNLFAVTQGSCLQCW